MRSKTLEMLSSRANTAVEIFMAGPADATKPNAYSTLTKSMAAGAVAGAIVVAGVITHTDALSIGKGFQTALDMLQNAGGVQGLKDMAMATINSPTGVAVSGGLAAGALATGVAIGAVTQGKLDQLYVDISGDSDNEDDSPGMR